MFTAIGIDFLISYYLSSHSLKLYYFLKATLNSFLILDIIFFNFDYFLKVNKTDKYVKGDYSGINDFFNTVVCSKLTWKVSKIKA